MGGKKSSPKPPQLQAPREVPLSETFAKFLGQEAQVPALSSFASNLNRQFRQELETGLPGTLGATSQISTLVNQLLQGAVPADVQAQVQRQGAEQAMALGLPATSEMSRNLQARDFGLTTMELMQQGAAYTPGLVELANFLSPQQTQNYLFSTGQLRGEDLKAAQDQANTANQNAINKYNYDVANARSSGGLFGTIGGVLGGIGGAALGSVFPGIGTAAGASLGSALGGSIGSFASGGGFAPTSGAGAFGGLIGNAAGGLFGGGGGLSGGGQALSPTAFSSLGQAYTMPTGSYFSPSTPSVLNPLNNFLVPQSRGSYGGIAPITVGGVSF
jgi:hypothetical protein